MAAPVLNLGAFSDAELTSMLAAAKAEYLLRMGNGRVRSGSSAAQSYGMDVMTVDDLVRLINSLTTQLGLDSDTLSVRPDFNTSQGCVVPGATVTG
ncbi:MAG: hypothetical protein JSR30_00130 [Proteobacteria bacterium]|nr:hypothetical protein [Pseudomonadota bacterium]